MMEKHGFISQSNDSIDLREFTDSFRVVAEVIVVAHSSDQCAERRHGRAAECRQKSVEVAGSRGDDVACNRDEVGFQLHQTIHDIRKYVGLEKSARL